MASELELHWTVSQYSLAVVNLNFVLIIEAVSSILQMSSTEMDRH